MPKFRKKPVVIEAVQWKDGVLKSTCPKWLSEALGKSPDVVGSVFRIGAEVHIKTLEGEMIASDGDFIIQGVNSEIYPCKPDIFEKTYEPVD